MLCRFDHFVDKTAGDGFSAIGGGDFGVVDHTAVGSVAGGALADLYALIRSDLLTGDAILRTSPTDLIRITSITVCRTGAYIRHTPALIFMEFHDNVMRIDAGQGSGGTG